MTRINLEPVGRFTTMATLLYIAGIVVLCGYVTAVPDSMLAPPRITRVEKLWCPKKAGRGETPVTCVLMAECPPGRQLWSGGAEKDDPPDRRIATCHGGGLVCCLPPPSKLTKKTRRRRQVYHYDWISDENLGLVQAVLDEANARERRESTFRVPYVPQTTSAPGWVISFSYGSPSHSEAVNRYPYSPPTTVISSYGTNVYQQPSIISGNSAGIKVHISQAPSQLPSGFAAGNAGTSLDKYRVNAPNSQSPPLSNALERPQPSNPSSGRQPGIISQQMCENYARLTSHDVSLSPLLPGQASIPVRINDCTNYDLVVVGGTNASKGEFPHMAALGFQSKLDREWICGGSLISDQWILTAAHCLYTTLGSPKWIRLGWLGGSDPPEVEETVASVHRHPAFSQLSKYNDLGLIRMSRPIPLSLTVRPACLPPPPSPSQVSLRTGTLGVATGWGKTSYTGEASPSLLKVSLRVVDSNRCKRAYQAEMFGDFLNRGITKELICAGDEHGKDTCQGDSGGPLQTSVPKQNKCVFRIVGVTAYGKACGFGVPGLYTNVAEYLDWIENFVWPA